MLECLFCMTWGPPPRDRCPVNVSVAQHGGSEKREEIKVRQYTTEQQQDQEGRAISVAQHRCTPPGTQAST